MKGSSMLSKLKIVLVGVLALCAFAVAASSAVAAPEWLVNGTKNYVSLAQ
jgi:hypothetical protein